MKKSRAPDEEFGNSYTLDTHTWKLGERVEAQLSIQGKLDSKSLVRLKQCVECLGDVYGLTPDGS